MGRVRSYYAFVLVGSSIAYLSAQAALREAMGDEYSELADRVTVANSEHQESLSLLFAAKKALQEGRIEDAGFLFYAGQIRARVDMAVYQPVDMDNGNGPDTLLGAIHATLGPAINPVVMRDRDAFARIVTRLVKWTPMFDSGYEPGWKYKAALSEPKIDAAIKDAKESMIPHMQSLSTLLKDDEYYSAFKTVQDYNLSGASDLTQARRIPQIKPTQVQVSEAQYTAATDRLKQIEKARGIRSDLFPDKDELKRARKTNYKVVDGKVTYHGHDVPGVDAATFKALADVEYAKDVRHVYVMGQIIPGADVATFRVLDGLYARDKSNVYSGNVVMKVDNIDHFEIVNARGASSGLGPFQLESRFLFETGLTLDSVRLSSENLPVIGEDWARDGKWYYHGPTRVESADYASFKVIDSFSARDKEHEYSGAFTKEEWTNRRHMILKIR